MRIIEGMTHTRQNAGTRLRRSPPTSSRHATPQHQSKLMDRLREALRSRHYNGAGILSQPLFTALAYVCPYWL